MTKRVLYVEGNPDGTVGGSFILMLDLILGLDRARFEPIAVFRFDNYVAQNLRDAGVEVLIIPPRAPLVFKSRLATLLLAPVKKLVNFWGGFLVPAVLASFLRSSGSTRESSTLDPPDHPGWWRPCYSDACIPPRG